MGYEVQFSGGDPEYADTSGVFAFGSAKAVGEFGEWTATLDPRIYPTLRQLGDELTATNTMKLSVELQVALDDDRPSDDLRGLLEAFRERLGDGDEAETATIGDDLE